MAFHLGDFCWKRVGARAAETPPLRQHFRLPLLGYGIRPHTHGGTMSDVESSGSSTETGLAPSRRNLLRGAAGAAGFAAVSGGLLTACSSNSSSSGSTSSASAVPGSTVTFGSNYSDPAPKAAFAALTTAATASTKIKVSINTVNHNTFQQNITSYLQGTDRK